MEYFPVLSHWCDGHLTIFGQVVVRAGQGEVKRGQILTLLGRHKKMLITVIS